MAKTNREIIDECLVEIIKYQDALENAAPESVDELWLRAEQHVHIGKLSSVLDEEYKLVYAARKKAWAEAMIAAPKNKEAHAELAISDLRLKEAESYGEMRRWRNAWETNGEKIKALKYKLRLNLENIHGHE